MSKHIIYYTLLVTGFIVIITGLYNFFSAYGDTTLGGILNQVVGIILLFSGLVNIYVGISVRKQGIRKSDHSGHESSVQGPAGVS
jgi:uncharacterized membrane protein HdeD (DUF308 family)